MATPSNSKVPSVIALAVLSVLTQQTTREANAQAFTFTSSSLSYTENFDGQGTTTTPVFVPGWEARKIGGTGTTLALGAPITATSNPAYQTSTGGSTTGAVYNTGLTNNTDRSLGLLASGTNVFAMGASFLNSTGSGISSISIGFTMEQWRTSTDAALERMTFQYSLNAANVADTNATWTSVSQFDLVEKLASVTTNGAVDGTLDANRTVTAATPASLLWNAGQTLWIRWSDTNNAGNDALLSIDDFSLSVGLAAAKLYWDPAGSAAGTGGPGTLTATSLTWNSQSGGTGVPEALDSSKSLVFGGVAGSVETLVTVSGTVAANAGLEFTSDKYRLAEGQVNLGGSVASVTVETQGTVATIASVIAGVLGLTKVGEGTLVLEGNNLYSGTTIISAGVLSIGTDFNLGVADNDIQLVGGTLATSQAVTLGAARDLTGSGTLLVPGNASPLTIAGTVNFTTLTFGGAGNVTLTGTSVSLGATTFASAMTLTSTNPINVGGTFTFPATTGGTVTLAAPLALGSVTREFSVADGSAAVDLVVSGALSSASSGGRFLKTGVGTVELSGTTTGFTGGLQLGFGGATGATGGRLRVSSPGAFGAADFRFNGGVVETLSDMTGANAVAAGVSLGAGTNAVVGEIIGFPITFNGPFSLFFSGGDHQLSTTTTVRFGGAATVSGTGATGLRLGGTGTVEFAGTTFALAIPISVQGPTVRISASVNGTGTSAVNIADGRFEASGTLTGELRVGDGGGNTASLAPGGALIGTLIAGNAAFFDDASLEIQVDSATGTADEVRFGGNFDIGTGLVSLSITELGAGAILPLGSRLTIFRNTNAAGIALGTFEAFPDNREFQVGPNQFAIRYAQDADSDGAFNDVQLVVIPEPTSALLALMGAVVGCSAACRRRR